MLLIKLGLSGVDIFHQFKLEPNLQPIGKMVARAYQNLI